MEKTDHNKNDWKRQVEHKVKLSKIGKHKKIYLNCRIRNFQTNMQTQKMTFIVVKIKSIIGKSKSNLFTDVNPCFNLITNS